MMKNWQSFEVNKKMKAGWENAKESDPKCSSCRRPIRIFTSYGMIGLGVEKFIEQQVSPCQYCAETERLRGARKLLGHLIDERER